MNKHFIYILTLGLILTGCGGGGGGGSEPSAPAPQNITVSLTASADSAEVNSSITLTWSSILATSCSASGAWSGSKGTSGSESITIGVGGSNTFSLSCSATGANSGSASTTVNGLRYFDGKVFDGYIRGAEVFVDTNDNLTLDANEASVSTDNAGSFTKLLFGNGTLVSKGGFDLDTGADLSKLTLVHKLEGYEASKLASPFTTLIAYMSDASTINAALGIDASIDLLTTDPIPNLGEGIYDQMYEKGNQLTVLSYTLQNHSNVADSTSELYFQAIADQLEESYAANQAAVDIEDSSFISNVINKVETARDTTFSSDVKANLNILLSATIPLLKVYADASTTASVQRFAFSTLQNDVKDSTVIIGNASPTLLKYENNIFDYVATDQGIDEATINPTYNNAPTISSAATFSAAENQTAIGSVTATDADGDSLTYSISGSEINISSSGVLTFATAPDYETKNSYTATVTVSDGTDLATQSITVSITDGDDTTANVAPTISSAATFSAAENQTAIGSVTATDADGDSLTYSISGSEINISSSGVLTFATAPDYETKNSYTATVTVSDGTDLATQSITVNVTGNAQAINQAPVITSSDTFSLAENNTAIGSVTASDADGDSLTYSISGSEINISSSGVLTFASAPDYETKNSYTANITVSDDVTAVTQEIIVTIRDVIEIDTGLASSCETFVNDSLSNEFRYCWAESQSTSGTEYSANIVRPLVVTFGDNQIEIPNISYAELLYSEYGIILASETSSDIAWSNDQAYAIHQMMQKIPQDVRNEANDGREFSKWTLTNSSLTDDIAITTNSDDTKSVNISDAAFENANPRIASVEGKKGIYFSNRLHLAVVRFVTDNGNNQTKVNKILEERYGVSINIPDYQALTGEATSRFQAFQASELISIINMFEEMPSGFHKIDGLDYLVRRLNGTENPNIPAAPAIAWDTLGYIEFMEKGFKQFSIDYIHRLILHEKAHFLWAKVFDATLKADWVTLGGWYECSEDPEGWCTTKQTEFVSAYAHEKNPNEDMAESIAFFTVNPDALRSRSIAKYEFIRDRIMQGNIYISIIQENLTFEVYNLYPDYVFPGKIKKLQVSVLGDLNEDKTVTVEIELHALNNVLEGASQAFTRIMSTDDTYVDLYLYPLEGEVGTKLKGSFTLTKRAKDGYWKPTQLVLTDAVGNLRMAGVNDFGWRMYVNNPLEDTTAPLYIANSMELALSSEVIESQEVQTIAAKWLIEEEYPRENQGCYSALNDENPATYSLEKYSPQNYSGEYQSGTCFVKWLMPNYMSSGTWRANYIRQIDEAGNETRNYFTSPAGVDTGTNFGGTPLDELAPEVTLTTTNPDTTSPELDLNDIGITATPTNPDNPNGETKVEFRFRVKDDISGYQIGYYTFRDPQGLTTGFYHYPPRRSELFPTSEDLDWFEYTDTVILPAGSAPGTWGVVELTIRDRAQNFKTYNFTEIVSFDVSD